MQNEDFKHILISLLIGAGMAFFSVLFQGIADYLKAHAAQLAPAAVSSISYLFQKHLS